MSSLGCAMAERVVMGSLLLRTTLAQLALYLYSLLLPPCWFLLRGLVDNLDSLEERCVCGVGRDPLLLPGRRACRWRVPS